MPVLSYDGGTDEYSFAVSDTVPPFWITEESFDGGATWNPSGSAIYGTTLPDPGNSGASIRAQRANGSLVGYGPLSNVLIEP